MCGRASLTAPPDVIAEVFSLDETPNISPRFNVAPGQPIAILRSIPGALGARRLEEARWGIVRHEPDGRPVPVLLARVETVFARFRDAAAGRRCLVVVDGFYEWRGQKGKREPFHFRRRDGRPFGLAAVWEPANDGVVECTLLTAPAQTPVIEIHDRMPIPIAERSRDAWIDPGIVAVDAARALAVVDPNHDLVCAAVSTYVNDARHEGPACFAPAAQQGLF